MTRSQPDAIGVCGLGNMGLAIAERLAAARPVVGFDLDASRRDLAESRGIRTAVRLDDLASCRTIVLSLPTPPASLRTVAALSPLLAGGGLFIETSTVTPHDVTEVRTRATDDGNDVIEAAVLSGVQQMRDGAATLLVGGQPRLVEAALPVLEVIGDKILVQGDLGSGMAAKVINNAVAHAVMVVLVEAFALARATGVPAESLVALLSAEDGGLIRPLTHRIVDRVLPGDFEGGMPCEAALKDSHLALRTAERAGVPLSTLPAAHTVYERATDAGLGREDYAAIARLWAQLRPGYTPPDAPA